LPGTVGGQATQISDSGVVIGTAIAADGRQYAFRWTKAAGMRDLLGVPGGPSAMNTRGQVTGYLANPASGSLEAFLWTPNAPS
jgi:probable HAF family extracellular repeat protein